LKEAEEKHLSILWSKDGNPSNDDEKFYSDYLKFKNMTDLIQELGILRYELKFFEREIDSFPRDKVEKANIRRERTFKNICAVEKEIAKRMKGRITV
jgi:hypothetical protein